MNNYYIQAIYVLYPQVKYTVDDKAYDANDQEVTIDQQAVQVEADKLACKQQAVTILQQTDWTSIADVGNPQTANPYLVNQAAFISYRSTIRNYAVNPVENPVWPTQPTAQWSN